MTHIVKKYMIFSWPYDSKIFGYNEKNEPFIIKSQQGKPPIDIQWSSKLIHLFLTKDSLFFNMTWHLNN